MMKLTRRGLFGTAASAAAFAKAAGPFPPPPPKPKQPTLWVTSDGGKTWLPIGELSREELLNPSFDDMRLDMATFPVEPLHVNVRALDSAELLLRGPELSEAIARAMYSKPGVYVRADGGVTAALLPGFGSTR